MGKMKYPLKSRKQVPLIGFGSFKDPRRNQKARWFWWENEWRSYVWARLRRLHSRHRLHCRCPSSSAAPLGTRTHTHNITSTREGWRLTGWWTNREPLLRRRVCVCLCVAARREKWTVILNLRGSLGSSITRTLPWGNDKKRLPYLPPPKKKKCLREFQLL